MKRHESDKQVAGETPPGRKSKVHSEEEPELKRQSSGRRLRHSRSPPASPPPPKKKHRLREEAAAKEVWLRPPSAFADESKLQGEAQGEETSERPGVPKETPKSELKFPNRFSPPERPADEHGFYRFRYGESLSPRYKIISKLGEGTFGLVLECWDRVDKGFVAIKIARNVEKYRLAAMIEVHTHISHSFCKSLSQLEVLNTLKINAPEANCHCVILDKWFNYRGHVCMVFEKHGPSLFDFLKKNNYHPFDVHVVREIGYQLLGAVAFMHDLQLVHTDLKPENILFVKDGSGLRVPSDSEICVIDFGSATFENGHHGKIVSTRHYRAPEVVLGAKWNYECDLWSVGCILVELITGETLFQTHEDIEHLAMMEQLLGRIPKSLAEKCDRQAKKLFRDDDQLNWPDGASSRKSIRAVRRLQELRQWIADVGEKSVKSCLDEFVDLVASLMRFDPSHRLSAKDALRHTFFTPYENGTARNE